MPKGPRINQANIYQKALVHLSQSGPLSAKALCEFLGISQPAFSRVIAQQEGTILRIGRGPQTLYACHRYGAWGKSEIPIFFIDEQGTLGFAATLHPISPKGFYLESHREALSSKFDENFPYFLEDLRPSGFLGRLVPRLYPTLGLPDDISIWSDDHCLVYLVRSGWDLIGNLMIGEQAQEEYLFNLRANSELIDEAEREIRYPQLAEQVLTHGIPGSSAGGEQPKFLSILRRGEKMVPVIVKFSPPVGDALGKRIADLLVCEHIAHQVLKKYGKAAAHSSLIECRGRLFLEVERFDRNASGGRIGVISLRALDLEFIGELKSWSKSAEELFRKKIIDQEAYRNIVWLEAFGRLIGNSDMHLGNISFYSAGEKVAGLAPVYDMLPMSYAPRQNQLVNTAFAPSPPRSDELPIWNDVLTAARYFWAQVQRQPAISNEFKETTASNDSILANYFPFLSHSTRHV